MPDYRAIPEFYDAEYAEQPMLAEDVPFLLAHLEVIGDGSPMDLLELGCGTGRAAVPLAREGHRVLGVDVDPEMVHRAEISREEAGLSADQLRLMTEDVTDETWAGSLKRTDRFDLACCLFNTFLAFSRSEQQEACLRSTHRLLRPDGRLWLDVFNPNLELITGSIGGANELEPHLFHTEDGRTVLRLTRLKADLVRQVQQVRFDYTWFENGRRKKARRQFEMAWIMPRELDRLLRLCGFDIEQTWGDYDGGGVTDGSPRQIVLARKT